MKIGQVYIVLIMYLCMATACHKPSYILDHTFEDDCWPMSDSLMFSVDTESLGANPVMRFQVTFLKDYAKRNLYLKLLMDTPSDQKKDTLIQNIMIDESGNWLTEASWGVYPYTFEPGLKLSLAEQGLYSFRLIHYMRDEQVCQLQRVVVWVEEESIAEDQH